MVHHPFFAQYRRKEHQFSDEAGNRHSFLFPTYFLRSSACLAVFTCSATKVRQLVGGSQFRPVRISPSRSLLAFACYEHHAIEEMNSYREAVIAIPVQSAPRIDAPLLPLLTRGISGRFGQFVWRMPVTSAINRMRGKVLWGLPKEMSEIGFRAEARRVDCCVSEDGGEMFSLEVHAGAEERDIDQKMRFFTTLDGMDLKAYTHIHGKVRMARSLFGLGRERARLTLGDTPSARLLKGLELGEFPVETRVSASLRSILTLPERI
jgi:hypothetical protein